MNFGSNLKKIRKQHSLSLRELAELSNVSKTMLSEIEAGKKTPTITVAGKIASALGISLSALLQRQDSAALSIIRKSERLSFVDAALVTRQLVSPPFSADDVEISFVAIPAGPGASTGLISAVNYGSKEYLILTKGSIQVRAGADNICHMEEGDSLFFEAHIEHEIINTGDTIAEYFFVGRKPIN